jgi:hypothetical protein
MYFKYDKILNIVIHMKHMNHVNHLHIMVENVYKILEFVKNWNIVKTNVYLVHNETNCCHDPIKGQQLLEQPMAHHQHAQPFAYWSNAHPPYLESTMKT